jgi:uncharacterized protein YecE (DUF72 family)
MTQFFIGTSGFNYKDWREIFYPKGLAEKNWLAFYSQHYRTVEVNATFYRHFPRSVLEKWRNTTPDEFCFTLKGPRTITHYKQLQDIQVELDNFFESAAGLEDKLSVVLWQFPGSFRYSEETKIELDRFIEQLPHHCRQAFEFRHKGWFNDDLYSLLNRHNAGFVINDSSRFPAQESVTGNFVYLRFHGPDRLYASSYSTSQLADWAHKIHTYMKQVDVYAYFNNDFDGRAIRNADELKALVIHDDAQPQIGKPSGN